MSHRTIAPQVSALRLLFCDPVSDWVEEEEDEEQQQEGFSGSGLEVDVQLRPLCLTARLEVRGHTEKLLGLILGLFKNISMKSVKCPQSKDQIFLMVFTESLRLLYVMDVPPKAPDSFSHFAVLSLCLSLSASLSLTLMLLICAVWKHFSVPSSPELLQYPV